MRVVRRAEGVTGEVHVAQTQYALWPRMGASRLPCVRGVGGFRCMYTEAGAMKHACSVMWGSVVAAPMSFGCAALAPRRVGPQRVHTMAGRASAAGNHSLYTSMAPARSMRTVCQRDVFGHNQSCRVSVGCDRRVAACVYIC